MRLPKFANLKKMVRRVKRKDLPPEPKDLAELEQIPRQFTTTVKGDRCGCFTTIQKMMKKCNNHLKLLLKSALWAIDGTFKASPHIFSQIYAIHGNVNGKWLPLVIALLEQKTRATYEHHFEVLKEEGRRRLRKTLAPAAVSTDYEQGAIKAAQEIFPDCQVFGCLFHFGQVLWRKLQAKGLAVAYRTEENEQMRTDFHCLIAIAFVPVDDVEEVFDALAAGADAALNAVFQHVEENFLRGRLRARRRGARVPG
ncbi:Long-chain-fatty-acid--CoA ligase 1 [Frankliniella fusca]|uniref:Long-chain-fatty-acid--CoA ligase 1 n=1 Tax=Frankliniella fusca TaxID=407009 RepID=A0AAE1GYR0_9NEOP|nr:Long-chain-fatty-acid--CoA ligase 1 [Frankliniella fusca]